MGKDYKWAIRVYTTGGWYVGGWEDYEWYYTKKEAAMALPIIKMENGENNCYYKVVKL